MKCFFFSHPDDHLRSHLGSLQMSCAHSTAAVLSYCGNCRLKCDEECTQIQDIPVHAYTRTHKFIGTQFYLITTKWFRLWMSEHYLSSANKIEFGLAFYSNVRCVHTWVLHELNTLVANHVLRRWTTTAYTKRKNERKSETPWFRKRRTRTITTNTNNIDWCRWQSESIVQLFRRLKSLFVFGVHRKKQTHTHIQSTHFFFCCRSIRNCLCDCKSF